jgi:hypothetical protein
VSVCLQRDVGNAAGQNGGFWRRRAAQGTQGMLAETFIGENDGDGGCWAGSATVLDEGERARRGCLCAAEHRGTGLVGGFFRAAEESVCANARM